MSLFTFTASATHTATTNVTKNNCYPVSSLSISLLSFDGAKVRLFAYTDKFFVLKQQKNRCFIDPYQLLFVSLHLWK